MKRFVVEHHRLTPSSPTGVLSIFRVKRNVLIHLGGFNIDHRGTYCVISEAQRFLIHKGLVAKKHGNYNHPSGQDAFRIQEI